MTVRREIAEPRCETGARSREDPMRTRAVRGGFEGRARRPKARRSSGSAIAAEVFMDNVGSTSTLANDSGSCSCRFLTSDIMLSGSRLRKL